MPEPQSTEVVYVLGTPGSSIVKIGRTTNLSKRLADIQRMSPVPLEALWTHPGGHDLESNLHRHFKAMRSHGEWFTFRQDPVTLIRWAVADEPWLRPKVILTKEAKPQQRAPRVFPPLPKDSPEELAEKVARIEAARERLIKVLDAIPDPVERYEAVVQFEERFSELVRASRQRTVLKLKGTGRTWQEVGEILGMSGQRAHQISRGSAPRYGAHKSSR